MPDLKLEDVIEHATSPGCSLISVEHARRLISEIRKRDEALKWLRVIAGQTECKCPACFEAGYSGITKKMKCVFSEILRGEK